MKIPVGFVVLATIALLSTSYAQDKAQLEKASKAPAVVKSLAEPDGVAVQYAPDGSIRCFSRASASYDFSDEDDVSAARQEAVLQAKAGLAKFMKETVSADNAVYRISKKAKTVSDKKGESGKDVSMENARVVVDFINTHSEAVLSGLVILREERAPGKGSGGVIHVVMGVSSKTLEAAEALRDGTLRAKEKVQAPADDNKGYIRSSMTDF